MKVKNLLNSKFIILTFIVIVAAFLRLWQLGNVPPSPNWDEVSLGYNAYSILETGKDEYGKFLPLVLRSYDDYKPALYTYLTIPSVYFFGLNTFATRLPSALMGVVAVIAVYFLVNELFKNQKTKKFILYNFNFTFGEIVAVLTSFFLAISPWSVQFSRVAYEANSGVTLNIIMVFFFLKGLKNPKFLGLSAIFAGLGIYAYQSEKAFVPLLVAALVLIFRKQLFAIPRRYLSLSILVGLIVVLPMFFYIFTNKESLIRVTGTSMFNYKTEFLPKYTDWLQQDKEKGDYLGAVLENRRFVYAKRIISNYLVHFDPNFLFAGVGDIQRHHAPNSGLIYFFEIPLILAGIYFLVFGKFEKKTKIFIFSWILLVPIPASITIQVPQAIRTLNFLPTWQILSALGLISGYSLIKQYKVSSRKYLVYKPILYTLFLILASVNFVYYLGMYFVALNPEFGYQWQYGWKEAVADAQTLGKNYKAIRVTDDEPLDKSYMFFLFYLKYPPADYQNIGMNSSGKFDAHHYFDKYIFSKFTPDTVNNSKDTLFIGKPTEIPKDKVIKTIYNLDGTPAIVIGES